MKTISGKVILTTPVSLSDAAAIISDFAAMETGASDAVSVYIRRAADAFSQLVQFHNELRYSNSGPKCVAKKHIGDDTSEYRLNSGKNHEVIAKKEEEPLKVKKDKNKNLSEGNEGLGEEALVAETKQRKSGDIDGSNEQNSKKKKNKKQRVEVN